MDYRTRMQFAYMYTLMHRHSCAPSQEDQRAAEAMTFPNAHSFLKELCAELEDWYPDDIIDVVDNILNYMSHVITEALSFQGQ